jgi:hypothetical protein
LGQKFLDIPLEIPLERERPILIGQTETGVSISIPAARLAGRNLGVFGNSGTGKSWMVISLIEEGGVSLVLDLSQYPVTLRTRYLAELLRALRQVRERKFRPIGSCWMTSDSLFVPREVTWRSKPPVCTNCPV